jgi:hypothetical protein
MQKSVPSQQEILTRKLEKVSKEIEDKEKYVGFQYSLWMPIRDQQDKLKMRERIMEMVMKQKEADQTKVDEEWKNKQKREAPMLQRQIETYEGIMRRMKKDHEEHTKLASLRELPAPKFDMDAYNKCEEELKIKKKEYNDLVNNIMVVNADYYIKMVEEKLNMYCELPELYEKEKTLKKLILQENWLDKYLQYAKDNEINYGISEYKKDNLFENCNAYHQKVLLERGFWMDIRGHKHGCRSKCKGWRTNEYTCQCGYSSGWVVEGLEDATLDVFNIESDAPYGTPCRGEWDKYGDEDDSDDYEYEDDEKN